MLALFPILLFPPDRCIPPPVLLPIPPSPPATALLPSPQPSCSHVCWSPHLGRVGPALAGPGGSGEPSGTAEPVVPAPPGLLRGEQLAKPEPAGAAGVRRDAAQPFHASIFTGNSRAAFYRYAESFSPLRVALKASVLLFLLSAQKAKPELFSFVTAWIAGDEKRPGSPYTGLAAEWSICSLQNSEILRLSFGSSPSFKHKCADASPWVKTRKKKTLADVFPEIWGKSRGGGGAGTSSFSVLALPKLTSRKIILCDCNFFGQIYEVWLAFQFWTICPLCHFPLWISWDVCLVSPWLAN